MTTQEKPQKYYATQGQVAAWCGVTTQAISNWAKRFPEEFIAPDVVLLGPNNAEVLGWEPSRKEEWLKFAQDRQTARNKPRRWAAGVTL